MIYIKGSVTFYDRYYLDEELVDRKLSERMSEESTYHC